MILQSCLLLGASIFGFFLLNFPKGKIFMGDGGSYFIGFIVSIIGLLFAERHDEVSNWFILLLLIYPMYELLFSSYRRKFYKGASVTEADAEHLHSLIYLALRFSSRFALEPSACNSITSLFLWTFSLVSLIPATIWYDDQIVLINFTVLFMIAYTVIYQCILRPKFGREKIAKTE